MPTTIFNTAMKYRIKDTLYEWILSNLKAALY